MPPIEVDTNVSPYEWLNEEPAKKLYWCTGLAGSVDEKGICITHTIVLTTEHAAWVRRAQELAEYSDFVTTIGNPRCVSREEIDNWATHNCVRWIEDPSNEDVHYTRNSIRHELMPLALRVNPGLGTMLRKKIDSRNDYVKG
jgi:hypothetical protein